MNPFCTITGTDDMKPEEISSEASRVAFATQRGAFYESKGKVNQDRVASGLIRTSDGENISLDLICDGLGGYAAGEKASQLFCESLQELCMQSPLSGEQVSPEAIVHRLLTSSLEKYSKQKLPTEAGTTLLLAVTQGKKLTLCHMGDTRALLFQPNGSFIGETKDHKPQEFEYRFKLTRYIHLIQLEQLMEHVEYTSFDLSKYPEGLYLVLASDGVTDNLKTSVDEPFCHPQMTKLILEQESDDSLQLCTSMMDMSTVRMALHGSDEGFHFDVKPDNSACLIRRYL